MKFSFAQKLLNLGGSVIILALSSSFVLADDFVPSDEEQNSANTFILDADDTGGDIKLQFGSTLAETLSWNGAFSRFDLSDTLRVAGNLEQEGTVLTLDAENIGVGANVDIVAEQGTDNNGVIRYNATTNEWEFSNDGTVFQSFGSGAGGGIASDLAAVQVRRTTDFILPALATYYDVDFDTTDIENDLTVLEHNNVSTDNIDIKEDGMYMVYYLFTSNDVTVTHQIDSRVRLNDTSIIAGSEAVHRNFQDEYASISSTSVVALSAGDFVTFQVSKVTNSTVIDQTVFSVIKLEGVKGAPGAAGAQGLPGSVGLGTDETSFTIDQDNIATGVNVDIIAEQGSDNNGTLRYNATTNKWQLSNDGDAFENIHTESVFYAYDSTGIQVVNGTEVTLNIDTPVVSDLNYSLSTDEVTVTSAGLYKITLNAGFTETNTTGGARTSIEMRLQENGVDIPGALADCYLRETEEASCSLSALQNISAGGVIRARIQRTGGSTNIETLSEASRLIIERIR
jgi:hypothetical protein